MERIAADTLHFYVPCNNYVIDCAIVRVFMLLTQFFCRFLDAFVMQLPLLIASGEDLVQLPDNFADLLSSFCFVSGVPYFCDPLSTLLLGSAVSLLLLPFQDIHQRFGCLQSEQPLIVDVQPVLGFLSIITKFGQPLLIPGTTGKGEFTDFLSQLPKFLFIGFLFFDVLAVLLDLLALHVILGYRFECVSQDAAVGYGLGPCALGHHRNGCSGFCFRIYIYTDRIGCFIIDNRCRLCYTFIGGGRARFPGCFHFFYWIQLIQDFFAVCGVRYLYCSLPNGFIFIL